MGDDPRHGGLDVGSFGEYRPTLDDGPSRGMGAAQSYQQRAKRVVVHALQRNVSLRASVVGRSGADGQCADTDRDSGASRVPHATEGLGGFARSDLR